MKTERFVAYYRVSTAQQGRSGLGLEAQRKTVETFLARRDCTMTDAFTEVESGKRSERPKLSLALTACRLTGATLVIAKLDRLSRDAHFLLGLEAAGVNFVAADMPNANRLTVRLMAVIAQEEREMIAERTKVALAAAKARGVKLGGWKGGPAVDHVLGTAAIRERAVAYAATVGPLVTEMRKQGMSLRAMAADLTSRGVRTSRGGEWSAAAVRSILIRTVGEPHST